MSSAVNIFNFSSSLNEDSSSNPISGLLSAVIGFVDADCWSRRFSAEAPTLVTAVDDTDCCSWRSSNEEHTSAVVLVDADWIFWSFSAEAQASATALVDADWKSCIFSAKEQASVAVLVDADCGSHRFSVGELTLVWPVNNQYQQYKVFYDPLIFDNSGFMLICKHTR